MVRQAHQPAKARRRRRNAAMLCADVTGLEWTVDRYAGENMAQAGGETTAFECKVQADRLETKQTTKPRTDCATVDHAYEVLSRGETITVAGSDMMRLRSKLASFGVW